MSGLYRSVREGRPLNPDSRRPFAKPKPIGLTASDVAELERLSAIGYGAATMASIAKLPQDMVRIWCRQRAEAHDKALADARGPATNPTLARVRFLEETAR